MPESLYLINLQVLACNFIKKETLAHVFSCEFWKFVGPNFPTEYLRWLFLKYRSDFQTKGLKREKKADLKTTAVDRNSITKSYFNAIK